MLVGSRSKQYWNAKMVLYCTILLCQYMGLVDKWESTEILEIRFLKIFSDLCHKNDVQGGGHWPRKGVWGCAALKTPLFTPLLLLARVPFQAKGSVHKTPFWKNLEILASTASIFTQILAHKPPNLEIFSSQAPKIWKFQLTSQG